MEPKNAGQLHECGSSRTEMNFEASHEKVRRQQTVLAHERHDLVGRGQKGDQVDESEQAQDYEAREPIGWRSERIYPVPFSRPLVQVNVCWRRRLVLTILNHRVRPDRPTKWA